MKNYKSLLEEIDTIVNGNLEEGAFGDIFATVKLGRGLAKLAQKMQKSVDPKNPESVRDEFKKLLNDGMKLIEQSKMSPDMKETFTDGWLQGVFKRLREIAPGSWSGSDLKRAFEIPDHIYRRMLSGQL